MAYESLVQKQAPTFKADAVINGEFGTVDLSNLRGKWVVLFFYPLDFTFVCPTEITAFSDASERFKKLNAEVIGVSVDSKYSHLAWVNTPRGDGGLGPLKIPLVADMTKAISRDYGVLIEADGTALRGLFVIDPDGRVAYQVVHDLNIGRNVGEVVRVLEALQYSKEHGEVCPANWTPGEDGMKEDVKGSKAWFKKHT